MGGERSVIQLQPICGIGRDAALRQCAHTLVNQGMCVRLGALSNLNRQHQLGAGFQRDPRPDRLGSAFQLGPQLIHLDVHRLQSLEQ